ncbi:MAG TPA: beta-galactosidase [Bacteroidales bacterium]|nr:beta-galactosidase [Bacteroidales bacterium]
MEFKLGQGIFEQDGKPVFLISGEIHYFRIDRALWDKHLDAAVEAGIRTVSSYVPWAWHEPEENLFDLEGKTHPQRDLKAWIEACERHGLTCILKPGPFILAEFRGAGLPDWFVDRYASEVRMRNSRNALVNSDGVNLFHPDYLLHVSRWYDQIIPFIAGRQAANNGPVIMMQLCNEIGVFSWLAHQADYSEQTRQRLIAWLEQRYGTTEKLNKVWNTRYEHFSQVQLPPDGRLPYANAADRARDYDWHMFWRSVYGDYLRLLTTMVRERGLTVPLYHNLPGWIYGHGYEFPVNHTMYDDLYDERSELVFGVDHIPEFLNHRNMHDDRIINDITSAMQGTKPLFAAEFQSGSREYHVVTNPREMALFYKASIIHGLKGWNYYMFSQGKNPPRKGYSGDTFYWFNPLTADGDKTSAYGLVKQTNRLIGSMEQLILSAERRAEIGVLFYPPYYATELERPEDGASALRYVPAQIRRSAWFDGLLKALQVLNVDYDMADLSRTSAEHLVKYKQVWAFASDEMDARAQQCLSDYASNGGQLVIFPTLPDRDQHQQTCTILRDAAGIQPTGSESIDSPLIDLLNLRDIKCANPQMIYDEADLAGAKALAYTLSGAVCGWQKPLGSGSIVHLGTWLGFDTEGHLPAYKALLDLSEARQQFATATHFLTVRQRFTPEGQGLLFVANYYNEAHTGKITYTHPESNEIISVPYGGGEMLWPPLYACLSPLNLTLSDSLRILHTTSDLLDLRCLENAFELVLQGDRDLMGEMVLEGESVSKISEMTIDGKTQFYNHHEGRLLLRYIHPHRTSFVLKIALQNP